MGSGPAILGDMPDDPDQCERVKTYFKVSRPAHFRVRPDLIEELGLPDHILGTLPTTIQEHDTWLKWTGFDAALVPFASLPVHTAAQYKMTARYVLKSPVLPGRLRYMNVILDGNFWVCRSEYGGLFDHVILRAVEFALTMGLPRDHALRLFRAGPLREAREEVSGPTWGVGFEAGTGLCTILALKHEGTEQLFLRGRPGYYTPFPDPN